MNGDLQPCPHQLGLKDTRFLLCLVRLSCHPPLSGGASARVETATTLWSVSQFMIDCWVMLPSTTMAESVGMSPRPQNEGEIWCPLTRTNPSFQVHQLFFLPDLVSAASFYTPPFNYRGFPLDLSLITPDWLLFITLCQNTCLCFLSMGQALLNMSPVGKRAWAGTLAVSPLCSELLGNSPTF